MECGRLNRVSLFLKWMKMSSPTRALISGPGMRVWAGSLRFQLRVNCS